MGTVRELVKRDERIDRLARAALTWATRTQRPAQVRRFLAQDGPHRVILGASTQQRDGWLSTDLLPRTGGTVYLDATKRFPFPDRSIDRILSEHMIEHMDRPAGSSMLSECHRVLVPGGRIRLATPNIDNVLQLAAPAPGSAEADYVAWSNEAFGESLDPVEIDASVHAVNRLFREWGHRFLYSPELLVRDLERAGFSSISRASVGASDDVDFDGIDFHGETVPDRWNRFETMVFEAEKA